jgi:hypothetical protein
MTDYDAEWEAFLRGHRQEMEDALLPSLAQAEAAGVLPKPDRLPVKVAGTYGGITVEYPDGEPAPGTPMKLVTFFGRNGEEVQVPMPANVGPKGMRVRINGIDGILFNDDDDDLDVDDAVEEAIRAALDVHAKQVGHNGVMGLYGIAVSDQLRDELVEAWDGHYQDHGCQAAAQMLDRILEQLIEAFKAAQ